MRVRLVLVASLLILSTWSAGCAMPAHVRSPRTLEAGKVEAAIGFQRSHLDLSLGGADVLEIDDTTVTPMTPTVAFRLGLSDTLELGVRGSTFSAGFELTAQILESRHFDLAVGVDAGWHPVPTVPAEHVPEDRSGMTLAIPVLAGLNLFEDLTLIGLAAPVYATDAIHLQVGGGVEIRTIPGLRLRPHVSYLHARPFGPEPSRKFVSLNDQPFIVYGLDLAFGGSRY